MPKKFIKALMPEHEKIKNNKHLQIFGKLLFIANLWHLNRRSVRRAFAVGLFYAFIPVPFQMILAAGTAIIIQANLPLSVALVWITNPLTMPAIFYFCYKVGTWLVGTPNQEFTFEASWQWLVDSISTVGPIFLLGCLVLGIIFSALGYIFINVFWRLSIIHKWKNRKI